MGFLGKSNVKKGFHEHWVSWVMNCVYLVSYNVIVSGKMSLKIWPAGGIGQGYLLSPYLFIMVIDILSRLDNQFVL